MCEHSFLCQRGKRRNHTSKAQLKCTSIWLVAGIDSPRWFIFSTRHFFFFLGSLRGLEKVMIHFSKLSIVWLGKPSFTGLCPSVTSSLLLLWNQEVQTTYWLIINLHQSTFNPTMPVIHFPSFSLLQSVIYFLPLDCLCVAPVLWYPLPYVHTQ